MSITNNSIYFDYVKTNPADTEYFLKINFTSQNQNITGFPIWFSSSSSTEKHIASNLTDSVNVSVIISNITSCNIASLTYTPNGSSPYTPEYTCNPITRTITFNTLNINPSAESNEILIEYLYDPELEAYCIPILQSLADIPAWFAIILVVAFCIVLISMVLGIIKLVNDEVIDLNNLNVLPLVLAIISFLFIIGLLVFLYALMIGGLCG
jgi:uncharacterized membrane protein YhdT